MTGFPSERHDDVRPGDRQCASTQLQVELDEESFTDLTEEDKDNSADDDFAEKRITRGGLLPVG